MTMLSFRVDVQEAVELQRWASELEVDKSELLRNALHTHLVQLAVPTRAGDLAISALGRKRTSPVQDRRLGAC